MSWTPTRHRPARRWPPLAFSGLAALGAIALLLPIGGIVAASIGGVVGATTGALFGSSWRQLRTAMRFAQLPFHVARRHPAHWADRVGEVVIRLSRPVLPAVLEDALADARAGWPALRTLADEDARAVSISQWAWSQSAEHHLQALADLLEHWGRKLHDVSAIDEVIVRWVPFARIDPPLRYTPVPPRSSK